MIDSKKLIRELTMNRFNLYYREDMAQRSMDILCTYLRSFGNIISQSTRKCYLVFGTNLTKEQMEIKIRGMKNVTKIEIDEN